MHQNATALSLAKLTFTEVILPAVVKVGRWRWSGVTSSPGRAGLAPDTLTGMKPSLDELPKIGAPATRALNGAGYTKLRELAGVPRADLAKLHGMGPKALGILQAALAEHDLSLG